MSASMNWAVDGADWPNRASSRFVRAGGLSWHVQVMGSGPVMLLLHGTGASTHSWRRLAPLLATRFTVVAPDLPGHAFTGTPAGAQMGLPGMARLVGALLRVLDLAPSIVVGHSAGAAIGLQMAATEPVDALVSINGALMRLEGAALVFPVVARLLALTPAPRLFSRRADGGMVDRLLAGTGSRMDPVDAGFYARLLSRQAHVAGALRMMSRWDLGALDWNRIGCPVTLVAGTADKMVPPDTSVRAASMLKHAEVVTLPGLGHLAHEESPERVAGLIVDAFEASIPRRRAVA